MSKLTQLGTRGRRMLVIAVAVSATATTGAAAAAGHAPWSSPQRPTFEAARGSEPITVPTTAPITVTGAADGATASGSSGGEFAAPTTAATTTTVAPASTTSAVVITEPGSTLAPTPAPTEPAPTEPAPPAAPTTPAPPRADTQVPQTMSLTCTATGDAAQNTVACTWTNGAGAGFSKYRLLRGDGGTRGRVPFTSSDPNANSFVDSALPVGTFSYVLVALDGNEKAIGHSNPVYIQILPAG